MRPALAAALFRSVSPFPGSVRAWDFRRGLYSRGDDLVGLEGSGLTCTRSTVANDVTLDGTILPFAANAPRRVPWRGLGVWEARTQLIPYSGDASNADWVAGAGSKITGVADPLGGTGAGTYTANGASAIHSLAMPNANLATATPYVMSAMVRAGTTNRVQITGHGSAFSGGGYANFLLSGAGSISQSGGTLTASGITALAGAWYLIWIAVTSTGAWTGDGGYLQSLETGNETRSPTTTASGSFDFFGGNITSGAFPVPYIATTSAAVSCSADVNTVSGLAINDGFTVVASVELSRQTSGYSRPFMLDAGVSETSNAQVYVDASTRRANSQVSVSAVSQGDRYLDTGAYTLGAISKMASRFGALSRRGARDGVLGTADTDDLALPMLSRLNVGLHANGTSQFNGYIRSLAIYARSFSDAELQAVTAP